MKYLLLASAGVIVDVVFIVLLLLGLLIGVKRGFIKGICKLAGTLFAIIFALFFCISFEGVIESLFGMRTAISNGLLGSLSEKELFQTELSGMAHDALIALFEDAGIGGAASSAAADIVVEQNVPEGTTLAMIAAPIFAKWISIAISAILLFVLIKLATVIIASVFTRIVEKIKLLRILNRLFGGLLGLFKACVLVFILLMIATWLPFDAVQTFIDGTTIVRAISQSEWFIGATRYIVSFEWLTAYLTAI